jgi:hypothetical protein
MHRTMYSPVCALPKRRGREISSGILRGGAQRGLLADQRLVYTCTTTPRVTRLYSPPHVAGSKMVANGPLFAPCDYGT